MSIAFKCSGCGKPMSARDDMTGKKMRCKACSAITSVPPPDAAEKAPGAAASGAPAPERAPADRLKPGVVVPPKPLADATISFKCSGCGRPMNVRGDLGGKKIRCKGCGAVTVVPGPDGEPAAATVPPAAPPPAAEAPAAPSALPVVAAPAPVVVAAPPASPPPSAEAPPPAPAAPGAGDTETSALRSRAEQAEQAIHSMAGQHALEKINLTNRILALEAQVRDFEAKARNSRPAALTDDTRKKMSDWLDALLAGQEKALREQVEAARKLLAQPGA